MRKGAISLVVLGTTVLGACSADRLVVPNFNSPTPEGAAADPAVALQLAATGILATDRANAAGYVSAVGIMGRESYVYTPQEGRNTSGYLRDADQNTSFSAGVQWGGRYGNLRNLFNFNAIVEGATALSAAQKAAALGFSRTFEALELSYVITTRHDLGAPVEIGALPTDISPFVSRDSVYSFISGRLNDGKTSLLAGGASFPFVLHAGFAGFNTPANFLKFNRALAARIYAYRASLTTGAARTALYQQALTALNESFLVAGASFNTGVFHVYSTAAGDLINGNNSTTNLDVLGHTSFTADRETGDARYTTKIRTLATPRAAPGTGIGIPTNIGFTIYPVQSSPLYIIRNEELNLLRSEARYFTGDVTGALADLNAVRTTSGALAALSPADIATEAQFITRLLYERRFSLMFEGHRWIDVRRFGRLNTLPLDLPVHKVFANFVVPQAECLARDRTGDPALKGTGCP
jgi:starch-binding outer membrane protein, SusD/RagB family